MFLCQHHLINSFIAQMYINRLIREDRDRQIERVSQGKDYTAQVENEISDIEVLAVSFFFIILLSTVNILIIFTGPVFGRT